MTMAGCTAITMMKFYNTAQRTIDFSLPALWLHQHPPTRPALVIHTILILCLCSIYLNFIFISHFSRISECVYGSLSNLNGVECSREEQDEKFRIYSLRAIGQLPFWNRNIIFHLVFETIMSLSSIPELLHTRCGWDMRGEEEQLWRPNLYIFRKK